MERAAAVGVLGMRITDAHFLSEANRFPFRLYPRWIFSLM